MALLLLTKELYHYFVKIFLIFLISLVPSRTVAQFNTNFCKLSPSKTPFFQHNLHNNKSKNTFHYDQIHGLLKLKVNPQVSYINGSINIYYKPIINNFYTFKTLLHDSLMVDSVKRKGLLLNWSRNGDHSLEIELKDSINNGQLDSLTIFYSGLPQADGLGSFVNDTMQDSSLISWSLSQPYGAKNWWPSKNSLNDKWESFDIAIETPLRYKAASNGLLKSIDTIGNSHIFNWKTSYPIADYLIAVTVGEYEIYEHKEVLRGDSLLFQHFLYPNDSLSIRQSINVTPVFMQYFDSLFGAYPFKEEKYGHATFTFGGGMEHQTMSFMGSYGGELIAHELAHQWFGNLITCNSWQELWLNEAFAVYATHLTYEFDILHDSRYLDISLNNFKAAAFDFPNSSVFIEDTSSADKFFTRLPYYKGAALLHMIRWQIGDSAFFEGIRNYVSDTTIRFGFSSTTHLKTHFEISSQLDLSEFFKDWYYGKGFPTYHIAWEQNAQDLKLIVNQSQSDPSVYFFNMPIPIQLIGDNWDSIIVIDPKFSGQVFNIELNQRVDSIAFDPEQWIAAKSNIVTSVHRLGMNDNFKIYPNPTNGQIQIEIRSHSTNLEYKVYTLSGTIVSSGVLNNLNQRIDISEQNSGLYYLKIGEQQKLIKLLKQ